MSRYRDFFGKLHRKHKKKAWCLGVGALGVLASVLLLGGGAYAVEDTTLKVSGKIDVSEASDLDSMAALSAGNIVLQQEFTVTLPKNKTQEYKGVDSGDPVTVNMGTYEETGTFSPGLKNNIVTTDITVADASYAVDTNQTKTDSKTYYRVVYVGETATSLSDTVRSYYSSEFTNSTIYSGKVMLADATASASSLYSSFLTNLGSLGNNLIEYTWGTTEIPLYSAGKAVKQVQMLTVSVIQTTLTQTGGTDAIKLEGVLCTEHTYNIEYNLSTPDISVASALSGVNLTSALLSDDKIVLSEPEDLNTLIGGEDYIYQYALGSFVPVKFDWTDYEEPFSPGSYKLLFIRRCPVNEETAAKSLHVSSDFCKIQLSYNEQAALADVTSTPYSGKTLTKSEDPIELSHSSEGAFLLYTVAPQKPSLKAVWADERKTLGLDSGVSTSTAPALKTVDSNTYLYINDRWYQLETTGTEWKLSEAKTSPNIEISALQKKDTSDASLNKVYVMALQDGHSLPDDFQELSWKLQLSAPTEDMITTQSGASIDGLLSEEEKIVLEKGSAQHGATLQYALSNSESEGAASLNWKDYSTAFSVDKENPYLYVRWQAPASSDYGESEPLCVKLEFLSDTPAVSVTATPAGGTTVNVGDTITLKTGDDTASHTWLYIYSDRTPVLTRLTAAQRERLGLDNKVSGDTISTTTIDGTTYLKFNDVWYQSSDAGITVTTEKELKVTVDESIRQDTMLGLYALVLESGKELGNFTSFRYYYGITGQTAAPMSTVPTSADAPAEVNMGDPLGLECSTSGSRIFYTTNGSVPSIDASGSDLRPTGSTKEYKSGDVIVVSEDFATYGRTFTITALAVTYTQYNGGVYRVYNDSEVVRFTYQVSDQAVVEGVSSIPATTAANPTEVEAGSSVQLYCGTEGVRIYYTVDGSEPVFDEDTGQMGANTYLYTTGVTVPEADGNTMFTITAVAYKEGLATSALSRLVFQYPSAVSMPYAVPAAGSVTENTEVALRCSTEGAVIYYEIAYGNSVPEDPTEESNVFDSSNPFRIRKKTTIKAYAVSKGMESAVATFVYEVSDKLSTPTPSVETGTTVPSGTRLTLDADSGATVYYTLDGSDPKDPENTKVLIGTNVLLSGDAGSMVVLRTYAARTGYSDSEVGTYSYNISSYSGGIYADIESGSTVKNGDVIHLNTDVSDAVIYYTTDGSSPTENSASGNAVTINGDPGENVIVMAIAVADGTERSITSATFTYTIMDRLAAPSASVPDGAVFTEEGQVVLTAETGRIYYTTDGADPSTASTLYKDPIVIDTSVQIKAIAVAEDYEQSSISSFSYGFADQVEAPTASYASGELEMGTMVTFASATEGATIYYRTDGVEPDTDDLQNLQVYTGPITVNKATNFKVIAVKDKMRDSRVLSVGYTVREPEAPKVESAEETQLVTSASGRLQSRRNFADTQSGPSFTDVVLRNAVFGAVISAEEGSLPENAQLQVERTQVTETTETMVRQMLSDNYGIVASYDVKLLEDGEEVQPSGEIEIGLPIPAEYENSLIRVVHVQEDGSVEVFETRRSGGVAYVMTDHLSVYAIAAPVEFQEGQKGFPWTAAVYTAAVALAGAGIFLIYRSKKMKREGRGQDE